MTRKLTLVNSVKSAPSRERSKWSVIISVRSAGTLRRRSWVVKSARSQILNSVRESRTRQIVLPRPKPFKYWWLSLGKMVSVKILTRRLL